MFFTRWAAWLNTARASTRVHMSANNSLPDSTDLSWIQNMASIGDSYAAGLGSGKRVNFSCSQYSTAYPKIVHDSLRVYGWNTTHQSSACSGADTPGILAKQAPALNGTNFDLITISAGGNDIGLTPILNLHGRRTRMQESIEAAREKTANDTQLFHNITRLIEAAKPHLNSAHSLIYITGYARFFGTADDTCDNVTWAVWRNIERTKQYLKLEMRQTLNNMVLAVSTVLRRATESAGLSVHFVDYDVRIATSRGWYCELGVHEPDVNRWGHTVDRGENKTGLQTSTGDGVPKGSFESGIAERINKTLLEHPDRSFNPDKGFVVKNKIAVCKQGIIEDTIHWLIPDSYKRVFHLRPEGHWIVSRMIWDDLEAYTLAKAKPTEVEEL